MITEDRVTEMSDGKDKELMKILQSGAKPIIKKCDGYAVKCEEDKEITFTDHEGQENTFTVPEGSYIVTKDDSNYPKILTAEEFASEYTIKEGESPEKKAEEAPKKKTPKKNSAYGMESLEQPK